MRFVVSGLFFLINFVCSQNVPDAYPSATSISTRTTTGTTTDTTTTVTGCDAVTPAPDYASQCNATNSFTLPSGRLVDEYSRFCDCAVVVLATQRAFCQGGADFNSYRCNTDGTFNCIYTQGFTGRAVCLIGPTPSPSQPGTQPACNLGFCEPACIRYSKDLRKFQNIRSCSCVKAQNQQLSGVCADTSNSVPNVFNCEGSANDNYVPQCNEDGSWNKVQTGYGAWWCVDSNGNQNGEMSVDGPIC